jgi:lysophospholipase L1-like esterase
LKPAEKIRTLNTWLKEYCESHGLTYLDYYTTLTDEEGGMKKEFTVDGVHASAKGYAVMQPLAQAAIDGSLAKSFNDEGR